MARETTKTLPSDPLLHFRFDPLFSLHAVAPRGQTKQTQSHFQFPPSRESLAPASQMFPVQYDRPKVRDTKVASSPRVTLPPVRKQEASCPGGIHTSKSDQ